MIDEMTLIKAAYHEAGHAVVWHINGFFCDEVSIGYGEDDRGQSAGGCRIVEPMVHYVYPGCYRPLKNHKSFSGAYKKRADKWIGGLLAGPLAEKKMSNSRTPLYSNGVVAHGGGHDFKEAVCLAKEFYSDTEVGFYLKVTEIEINKLLRGTAQ